MSKEQVQWAAPSPLWPIAAGTSDIALRRNALRKPVILRFAADTFMDDFVNLLETDPSRTHELVATPEIILSTPDNLKFEIIEEIHQALAKDFEVITVDGARALFPNGWGLVRASNTQPAITLRFEAYTREQIVEYMRRFKDLLDHHPEIDQSRFVSVIDSYSQEAPTSTGH